MTAVSITVRPMQTAEARRFLEVHHASVRGLAANDYPPSVVEAWAPPITDEQLQRFLQNRDGELRLIAERDGEAVGIGAIVAANSELRACYVLPSAARQGVGAPSSPKSSDVPANTGCGSCTLNRRSRRSRSTWRWVIAPNSAANTR